jgi:DNA-binding response OmpR family regulator
MLMVAVEPDASMATVGAQSVVVVEDDDHIAELLDLYLVQAGFRVFRASAGEEGLNLIAARSPDLVVLDIGLPGDVDGLDVCRRLRGGGSASAGVPVLLLTARDGEVDRVLGLELGADDYVTKPFSPRELVARVRAILRRTDGAAARPVDGRPPTISVGAVEVDLARREARVAGAAVDLTPREFALLQARAENRGLALSRRQLLDAGWGHDWYGDERTVDVHVRQLRRKLGDGLPLVTLRGTGYRLD